MQSLRENLENKLPHPFGPRINELRNIIELCLISIERCETEIKRLENLEERYGQHQ